VEPTIEAPGSLGEIALRVLGEVERVVRTIHGTFDVDPGCAVGAAGLATRGSLDDGVRVAEIFQCPKATEAIGIDLEDRRQVTARPVGDSRSCEAADRRKDHALWMTPAALSRISPPLLGKISPPDVDQVVAVLASGFGMSKRVAGSL